MSAIIERPVGSAPIGSVYVVAPGGAEARGGIGRMVRYFTRTWNVQDAPIRVIDSYGPGPKALMPGYFAAAMARLAWDGALGRIGLLHVHMSERASVIRKGLVVHLGAQLGIPVVLHLHGAEFAEYCQSLPPRELRMVRRMMERADAVVALGAYWREFVVHDLGIDPARAVILHNCVPGPAKAPVREGKGPCRLLFLGVLNERKGVPVLLDALASPLLAKANWHIRFAGNGDIERTKAEAASRGLGGKTEFLGWVDEERSRQLLAESDVLVLPSRNEGLPMAILEAMANGLPVVSTPVGAIADAVIHGETGLLTNPGDDAALARALSILVEDPALRARMGAAGRERWFENFDQSSFNHRLENLFRTLRSSRIAVEAGE